MPIAQIPAMKRTRRRSLPRLVNISIASMFFTAPAFAQTAEENVKQLELKLERSLEIIGDLSDRVRKLEQDANTSHGAVPEPTSRLKEVEHNVSQMLAGMASHAEGGDAKTGVPLHGYADALLALHGQGNSAANPKGFRVGSLDLFFSPQFRNNVKSLFEIDFWAHADGSADGEVERFQIGYTFSDAATVWAGRFHTPYGYWNTACHHGAQIQTSIMRPRFLDFEDHDSQGGVLPAHTVGLWATGKLKAGPGHITYDAFMGNGPRIEVVNPGLPAQAPGMLDPTMGGDRNFSLMGGLNAGYEFSGLLSGLRLAAHWFGGDVDDNAVNASGRFNRTGVNIAGGSVVYLSHEYEVISEYYHFGDKDKSGGTGTHASWAGFLQGGKMNGNLTSYARLEKAVLDQMDNYFAMQANGQSYTREALGLKYDIEPNTSVKLEVFHTQFAAQAMRSHASFNTLLGQFAIRF